MKKIILMIMLVSTVWFTACGGGDKEEAKELLKRILKLVGIPQNIVVNICQDANANGICGINEIQTKVTGHASQSS
jgi:hypothetical protein